MKLTTRSWSTPLVIGAGLFVAVSGTLMFWRLAEPLESAHEWIGLAFAAGILLHVLNHWRSFRNYFSNGLGMAVIAICLIGAGGFVVNGLTEGEGGGVSVGAMFEYLSEAPLASFAGLRDISPDELVAQLQAGGVPVDDMSLTVAAAATASGLSEDAVLGLLFPRH